MKKNLCIILIMIFISSIIIGCNNNTHDLPAHRDGTPSSPPAHHRDPEIPEAPP